MKCVVMEEDTSIDLWPPKTYVPQHTCVNTYKFLKAQPRNFRKKGKCLSFEVNPKPIAEGTLWEKSG